MELREKPPEHSTKVTNNEEVEVVFGTTADEGLLYLLTAITDTTQLDLWR